MFPNFVFHQRGNAAIWIDRNFVEPAFLERLTDADGLFAESNCQIIKDQRKVKIGRLSLAIAGQPCSLFVKRYNAFSLRYTLASPFIRSGAIRSLQGAAILRTAQIASARPLAAVENRRGGALTKSFFVSEEITGGRTVDAYWRHHLVGVEGHEGAVRRRLFLAGLAQLFQNLHGGNLYHNDLKDTNILTVAGADGHHFQFVLVDLDGVASVARLSRRRRVKNLVQIYRTLGRYLRRAEKMYFLRKYLGAEFNQRLVRRRLTQSILVESDRLNHLNRRYA